MAAGNPDRKYDQASGVAAPLDNGLQLIHAVDDLVVGGVEVGSAAYTGPGTKIDKDPSAAQFRGHFAAVGYINDDGTTPVPPKAVGPRRQADLRDRRGSDARSRWDRRAE